MSTVKRIRWRAPYATSPVKHIHWCAPYAKHPDGVVKAAVLKETAPDAAAKQANDQKRSETRQLIDRIRASLKA